ncbi:UPF0061 protein [Lederbergia ruris]|uniref:Protein nucleotidyltransferase YdiU n=1 Tax=Lederbergia ruris TaxID=217495 RepID=A0ABQ4KGJ8_9BACI|nr:YdiU family protein [Lederbergia ruris]GIN57095.1 UPF0061 protein [Lederbergia ruris]
MNQAMGWNFDNSYVHLPKAFYTSQSPSPVEEPGLVFLNGSLANSLGLEAKALINEEGTAIFAGNQIPEGAKPIAQAYAGHQFGNFTMLGDGRAVLLGEQITPKGARVDIQLKGAGRTPYSRGGDGRAALGPMLREYLISEAMHALGIPTTRSLAVVVTGEPVFRETPLPGAILTRVAASHLRVGTFEYAARLRDTEELRALADYALERHYPELLQEEQPYLSLLRVVMERQARLIAKWQLVGFIHGVMNTDNITISGETIDYGPCAFMDTYDPATVFSSIDREGRYAYGNQPYMAGWNVARFAESLLPLLHENQETAVEIAQQEMPRFTEQYEQHWLQGMRAKLGLYNKEPEDAELVEQLLKWMEEHQADFTNTFRALTLNQTDKITECKNPEFTKWLEKWKARRERQTESEADSRTLMKKSNPSIIPRNHLVEKALEAAVEEGGLQVMEELLQVLADPYAYTPEQEKYTTLPEPSNVPYQTFCGT